MNELRERRRFVLLALKGGKCSDCGEKVHADLYPECFDFDHREPPLKKFSLNRGNLTRKWTDILDEVAKCDLVCANCHRTREVDRRGYNDRRKGE